jgi:hypothetical protein
MGINKIGSELTFGEKQGKNFGSIKGKALNALPFIVLDDKL